MIHKQFKMETFKTNLNYKTHIKEGNFQKNNKS